MLISRGLGDSNRTRFAIPRLTSEKNLDLNAKVQTRISCLQRLFPPSRKMSYATASKDILYDRILSISLLKQSALTSFIAFQV